MLEIFITWIYIFITSYCTGRFALNGISKILSVPGREERVHPVLYSLTGLIMITMVAGYLSLFSKTGLLINVLLCAFCAGYLFKNRRKLFRKDIQKIPITFSAALCYLFLFIAAVLVLVKASGPVTTPDSAGYHLPGVVWTEHYKAIKGLANVHTRLGFNYQYLVLCAVYGFSFLGIETLHALNGYIMLLIIWYMVSSLSFLRTRILSLRDVAGLIILFFILNMGNAASSFSPDAPTTVLAIFVAFLLFEKIISGTAAMFDQAALLVFILSIGAILFKISSAPVCLFTLFFIIPLLRQKQWRTLLALAGMCVLLFLPYFIRNYIISGYLVYPLYKLDLFRVPWKVPYEKVVYEKEVIKSYALGLEYGRKVSFTGSVRSWIAYLKKVNTAYIYIMLVLGAAIIASFGAFVYTLAARKVQVYKNYILFYAILYVSLIYWWLNAPDPRFGNGFIIPLIAITGAFFTHAVLKRFSGMVTGLWFAGLCCIAVMMIKGNALAKVSANFNGIQYNFLTQAKYPSRRLTMHKNDKGQVFYAVPDDDYCWDSPQPCSVCSDIYQYMGAHIEDGFIPAVADSTRQAGK